LLRSTGTCIPEITEYGRWKYAGIALSGMFGSVSCVVAALLGAFAPASRIKVVVCAAALFFASPQVAKHAAREDGRGRWHAEDAARVLGEVIARKEPLRSVLRQLRGRP